MNAVTFLLMYAILLSCLAPPLFSRWISVILNPRLALLAWLTVIGTTVFAWAAALVVLMAGALRSLVTRTAPTFCVETLGIGRAVRLSATAATVLVVVLLVLTFAVAIHTARRVVTAFLNTRRHNREHAEAVQIVGRRTDFADVVAIPADQPAAYCVCGGNRSAIVVTTAVLDLLSPLQFAAVLAHERAHIRGRHHHIITMLHALSASLPGVPLARAAAEAVPRLLEMCADDAAARQYGRDSLAAGLIAFGARQPVSRGVLAAAATDVVERIQRLMQPPGKSRLDPRAFGVSLAITASLVTPSLAFTLCTL